MTLRRFSGADLRAEYELRHASVPTDAFFNQNAHKRLQEMYCASGFAMGYKRHVKACTVHWDDANAQSDEDFFLGVNGIDYPVQLVEVTMPGRRRGLEYLAGGRPTPFDDEDFANGGKHGASWIAEGVGRKASRNYSTADQLHLLVYVNFGAWDLHVYDIRSEVAPFLSSFASLWLITGELICGLHADSALRKLDGWGRCRSGD